MERGFVQLYRAEELAALRKRALVWTLAAAAIGAAAFSVCVVFAVSAYFTETRELLPATIITSIAGGFAVITVLHFPLADTRAAISHSEAMLKGETETVEGTFRLTADRLFVRKGVGMIRVRVDGNESVSSLQLWDEKKQLAELDKAARVTTVYGFITGYEVKECV